MATLESAVKNKVKKYMKSRADIHFFMPVQAGFGAATLDILGCYNGKFFAIETKAPGKKLTARQKITKAAMEQAGGKVFVIDGDITEFVDWVEG